MEWEEVDGEPVCGFCLAGREAQSDSRAANTPRAIAEHAFANGEVSWEYASEDQAAALGLPAQTGGWGLLHFRGSDGTLVTAACDRSLVGALEEREGDLPGWESGVKFWALGWPGESEPLWAPAEFYVLGDDDENVDGA